MPVKVATQNDIPALVTLLNSAYRGTFSKQGWTTEADLLSGEERTDETNLLEMMQWPGASFLKYIGEDNTIEGCVFLQQKEKRLYLGMLSVSPLLQSKGIGKQLLAAADEHAAGLGCQSIYMRVISVRDELIAWYKRRGYEHYGEMEDFPTDNRFGTPTQPLVFMILEKKLPTVQFSRS